MKMFRFDTNHKKKYALIFTGFIVCIILVFLIFKILFSQNVTSDNAVQKTNEVIVVPDDTPRSLTSRLLFMGDIYWGRDVNRWSQNSTLKEAYPFSKLNEFDRNKYDAWIANLECPSVPGVQQPFNLEYEYLIFNCSSTYLSEASKWFTAFSLANNHTNNQGGRPGIDATRTALEEQAIQYFGDYDPQRLDDVCEVITISARIRLSNGDEQTGDIPIAMCGYHGLAVIPSTASLAVMQKYAKYMPVFAYPHMGVEYTASPTVAHQKLYRSMIDNGADAVFGGHPHWVQSSEVYKGKLIVYSMGNLIFDQGPGETQRGAMIDLTLELDEHAVLPETITALLTLGANCKTFKDSCLDQAEAQGLTKLPLSFHYEIVGADLSNKLTKPAQPDLLQVIKTRLNWDHVSTELN